MATVPHYIDHRKRLRERFVKAGAAGFHDYELLELLLTYAIARKDVKPLAKRLISRFGSLPAVLDAAQGEIEAVSGAGTYSAVLIRLVKELCVAYLAERMEKRDLLAAPGLVVDFARAKLAGKPNEVFMVIFLNVKNEVIGCETIQEGTIDRAAVYPRRIIESALAHHAAGVILLHNHPSGHPDPSPEDMAITRSLAEAARAVDIDILDHIVVARDGYCSLRERGDMG